jgi:RNA polymerase sigma-70 factor (ECF subfamily)
MAASHQDITRLLIQWSKGDASAFDRLVPLVYPELHRLARHYMRGERNERLLQPTALLHEAYLRLVMRDEPDIEWRDRSQFFAAAASVMRRVLVDSARYEARAKRGGGGLKLVFDENMAIPQAGTANLLEVDQALTELARFDERKARMIELRYFGGLTQEETAKATGVSLSTVKRDMLIGEAWLRCHLRGEAPQLTVR